MQRIVTETNRLFQDLTPENINRIVLLNRPLVIGAARQYAYGLDKAGQEFDDLVGEGIIGLHRAVLKFDPKRGTAFSTFAQWWIRASIQRYLAENSGPLGGRVTSHVQHRFSVLRRAEEQVRQKLGRDPTSEEVFPLTGLTRPVFNATLELRNIHPFSLDEPNDDGNLWREAVTSHDCETPEDLTMAKDRFELRADAMDYLRQWENTRNVEIFMSRFQMNGELDTPSYDELGQQFGVTRERIRQIIMRCLTRIRAYYKTAHRREQLNHKTKSPP